MRLDAGIPSHLLGERPIFHRNFLIDGLISPKRGRRLDG